MRLGYLITMVSITLLITLLTVPALFFPKCKFCGKRNVVSKTHCKHCGKEMEHDYISMTNHIEKNPKNLKE